MQTAQKIITYRTKVRKKTGTLEYKVKWHLKLFQELLPMTWSEEEEVREEWGGGKNKIVSDKT